MKKLSIFAALVVAMTAVSCVEDINNDAPVVSGGAVTFEASFGAMSKAVLEPGAEESKVAWEAGDQVSVLAGENNWLYTAASAGYSTTLATEATDVPSEGPFYAVYPYDNAAALADGKISTTLPAEQTAVLGSFSTHLAVAQTTGDMLAFKNVCGLVKVTVSDEAVTKVEFKGNTNEIVAGGVSVTVTDTPSWTATETGSQVVTLVPPGEATTLAKGVYYMAVLPQTFEGGITVTAYKGDEAWDVRKVETPVTVARSDIKGSNSFGVEGSGTEDDPYILDAAQDLVEMRNLATLGGETWFKMVKNIDMKGAKGFLPVNYNSDENFERKIHFDGGDFTISNFSYDKSKDGGNYASLFGVLYGSVKNLKVDKANIISSNACGVIGGYVGTDGKPGLVENVTITNASVTNSGDRAGGVCGNAKEATFKNVSFQGSVTCSYTEKEAKSGGFVGYTEVTATFEGCSADVIVSGKSNDVGGFIGKTSGVVNLSGCNAKVAVTFDADTKNRCGGFIGWNAATQSTISDCHVLAGSTLTSTGTGGDIGGFIGYADASATTTVDISNSSAEINLSATDAAESSVFIGIIGYTPTVTITKCFAKGENLTAKNYNGGLIGRVNKANVTISGCYFEGKVKGASGVSGLVGAIEGEGTEGALNIYKSYVKGEVTSTAHNSGGIVGLGNGPVVVENSYTDITFTQTGQFGGGIVGSGQGSKVSVKNCFCSGTMNVSRGVGGIVGRAEGATTTEALNCISWISKIKTNRGKTQYSVGAIVGVDRNKTADFKSCYRRADMVLEDVVMTLTDHEDVVNDLPVYPSYTTDDDNQRAYHGKAAAAGSTISSVAKTIGWDETIWDLSGDVPVLK